MLTFRLTKTLKTDQESDWKELVEQSLGAEVHPGRANGFKLAREALRECFRELGHELSIKDLQLEGFGQLKDYPSYRLSLSHTAEWGAAVVGNAQEVSSLGIDIEPLERVVKPFILARVSHPEDVDMSPIMLWSLKEASFKALMNTQKFSVPQEFSSIRISSDKWCHTPSGLEGAWKIEQTEGLVVALAWIRT